MGPRWMTLLVAGASAAVVTTALAACSSSTSGKPLAHIKKPQSSTDCTQLVTMEDLVKAVGDAGRPQKGAPRAIYCAAFEVLKRADGNGGGNVALMLVGDQIVDSAKDIEIAGNPAKESESKYDGSASCSEWVTLNHGKESTTLGVSVQVFRHMDACQAARQLTEAAFARIPDA